MAVRPCRFESGPGHQLEKEKPCNAHEAHKPPPRLAPAARLAYLWPHMKVAAPFLILLALLIALQMCRWQILHSPDSPIVYRLDRLTGNVEMGAVGQGWLPVGKSASPSMDAWGDHVSTR